MTTKIDRLKDELVHREAIKECLYRYCRGVDRLDADMVRSAYWPDVTDTHLTFTGNAEEFINWSFPIMKTMDQTMHLIGNVLINVQGEHADVESYFWSVQVVNTPDGKQDVVAAGRYLDRMELRDGEWRIARRMVMTDWFRSYTDSADWSKGLMGIMIDPGLRMPEDDSYKLIKLD